jgi:putative zinc finger/helix-turn-helix YgiT family protein
MKTEEVMMKKPTDPSLTKYRLSAKDLREGRVLPDDVCPTCGVLMKRKRGTLCLPINGEEIPVPSVPHLKCPNCGEAVIEYKEAKRHNEDAIAIYRRKYGLLSADEIRAIRQHYGLTQEALAGLLRLGANTVSRWESGRNVQSASLDILLRLIRDLPGSIDYLRKNAA